MHDDGPPDPDGEDLASPVRPSAWLLPAFSCALSAALAALMIVWGRQIWTLRDRLELDPARARTTAFLAGFGVLLLGVRAVLQLRRARRLYRQGRRDAGRD